MSLSLSEATTRDLVGKHVRHADTCDSRVDRGLGRVDLYLAAGANAHGRVASKLVGVDVWDRKLIQFILVVCRPPDADVVIGADVRAKAKRPPEGTHIRSLHQ